MRRDRYSYILHAIEELRQFSLVHPDDRLLDELTVADFESIPVWECRERGEDEFVRPSDLDFVPAMIPLVHIGFTRFIFADGTIMFGYCSPGNELSLDYTQPVIITEDGHWNLCDGVKPIAKPDSEIFPLTYECLVKSKREYLRQEIKSVDWTSLDDLSAEDLQATPVWEYLEEDEGEYVRPSPLSYVPERDDHVSYIAATRFSLADGSSMFGFCSPANDFDLYRIQPVIVSEEGCWDLCAGENDTTKLDEDTFPLTYECLVQCKGAIRRETIEEDPYISLKPFPFPKSYLLAMFGICLGYCLFYLVPSGNTPTMYLEHCLALLRPAGSLDSKARAVACMLGLLGLLPGVTVFAAGAIVLAVMRSPICFRERGWVERASFGLTLVYCLGLACICYLLAETGDYVADHHRHLCFLGFCCSVAICLHYFAPHVGWRGMESVFSSFLCAFGGSSFMFDTFYRKMGYNNAWPSVGWCIVIAGMVASARAVYVLHTERRIYAH